ncbi:MAG: sugar ABC transporter permease [Anaerolineaceae bacterium]|nr:sugar ABC transporter permease [Anaerolineaceae bacterium]
MVEGTQHVDIRTERQIKGVSIWQGFLAVGAAIGIVYQLGSSAQPFPTWLYLIILILLGILGSAAGFSVPMIWRKRHRGRIIALIINYLVFLTSLLGLLQYLGIFVGIDALGDTFGRGIPWLGGVIAGYLINSMADKFSSEDNRSQLFRSIGRYVIYGFLVFFFYSIGILQALVYIAQQFNKPLPFFLLAMIGITIFVLRVLSSQEFATALHAKSSHNEAISGFLFLSPNLLGFLFFFAGPLLLSLYVSFTNSDSFGTQDWVGMDNYAKIFNLTIAKLEGVDQPVTEVLDTTVYDELTRIKWIGNGVIIGAEDKLFWIALRNTIVFTFLALPLSIIPALLLASLLNSKLPGMKFFRAVYFLPTVAAVVGVALIWQWLYNAAVGYINFSILNVIESVNGLFGTQIADPQIRWLSDTKVALLAVVIMSAWQWLGYYAVIFLAGMQNIPKELYEAAKVDGANAVSRFWNVTLPLLAPTTFYVVTTAVINALQVFEQVYVLIPTEPPGGPANSTMTIVLYLYQKGFQRFQQGYASAVAWVLFLIIFVVTLVQFQRQNKSKGAY